MDNFRIAEKLVREDINGRIKRPNKRKSSQVSLVTDGSFDVTSVINVHSFDYRPDPRLISLPISQPCSCVLSSSDCHCLSRDASLFALTVSPAGFYVIRGALNATSQLHWAGVAVQRYSKSPHTNLTNLSAIRLADSSSAEAVASSAASPDDESLESAQLHTSLSAPGLWEESIRECNSFQNFKKLRWASLGFHYNWSLRMYKEKSRSLFPDDFASLSRCLARAVGQEISPEAGIVNYYPLGAQMCGHLDDAEHCMTEPIVSISIGCSCLFLLGGRTKGDAPVTLLLKSGDAVVMSGESRLCYHGVPVILPRGFDESVFEGGAAGPVSAVTPDSLWSLESLDEAQLHVLEYLKSSRVNINARRVTLEDEDWADKNGSGYQSTPGV